MGHTISLSSGYYVLYFKHDQVTHENVARALPKNFSEGKEISYMTESDVNKGQLRMDSEVIRKNFKVCADQASRLNLNLADYILIKIVQLNRST
jgi:hypothetical protein